MSDSMETYGIEALAAATMGAPAHRLALLAVTVVASRMEAPIDFEGLQNLTAWLEKRDTKLRDMMPPQDRLDGDEDRPDLDITTQTRPGVQSFGRP